MTSQTPADLKKTIEETLRAFILSYKDGAEQNDPAIINRNTTADCTRHLLPASLAKALGAPADFVIDNAEYQRLFASDLKVGGVQKSVISNLTIDAEAKKAAASTVSDMVFKDGEVLVMEHSWFLDFTDDGSKVKKAVEFCDSDSVHKLMAKVGEARQGAEPQNE
ncbi:hypothetical protein B0J13DRAFT_569432 [Dactylonectria estremocensis]|uniref:SnoaL-like domain-containing protein n=1 Tax=Dactylonectria estremocensis TaxID=1079267 RepID=A0A9P9DDP5_9HYPO|nr:hypothetical protein B0J13DRAFT_569432 [Dactylonectria estremocensis]